MRPHVICHMLSSLDGRIDSSALKAVVGKGEYETTGAQLDGDAWICGRTTMQLHFAEEGKFVSKTKQAAGPQPVHVARLAKSYAISIDTGGTLLWSSGDLDGDHLICVVSQKVSVDYLEMLREKGISYIVAGEDSVDLPKAVDLIGEHFGVRVLLLEGGGHINGAFLEAGLIDEISLLLVPGIDARRGIPTVFDGLDPARTTGFSLKLQSVEQRDGGTLWLRYLVIP